MIIMKILLILYLCISSLQARLVFSPGSDVGYILPDPSPDDIEYENPEVAKFLKENEVKNEVKRSFWDTVLDNFGEKNHLQTSSRKDSAGFTESLRRSNKQLNKDPILNDIPERLKDAKHGIVMGVSDHECDDAKSDLEVDWDGSPRNFTCYTPKIRLPVRNDLAPLEMCDFVPPGYMPRHYCMNHVIKYNSTIPTFGPHRPLWGVFGEYQFLPSQRWLHNIEHGSVVMLYHPCAEPLLVFHLKQIVKKCIYKHVISPSNLVSLERPLVLVAWGCKLELPFVDEAKVVAFIRAKALHGPEGTYPKQGSYTQRLLHKSSPPEGSDINDSNLCPSY